MPVSDGDNYNGGRPRWNGGYWDKSGSGSGSGSWGYGRGRGAGGRWPSSNRGRGSYEKYRPPSRYHSEGKRWGGTENRRHSGGSLVPGSSLLGSSNGQSSRGDGRDIGGKKRISSPSDDSKKGHDKDRGYASADDLPKLGGGRSREGGGISSLVAAGGENCTTDSGNRPESTTNCKRKWPGSTSGGDIDKEGDGRREADETDSNKGLSSSVKRNRSPRSKNTQKFKIGGDMNVSKRREAKLKVRQNC